MTARQQGRVDAGIELVDGESIEMISEPEVIHKEPTPTPTPAPTPTPTPTQVIHKEPSSLALTLHYTLRVDTGLSLASARELLDESLMAKERKS